MPQLSPRQWAIVGGVAAVVVVVLAALVLAGGGDDSAEPTTTTTSTTTSSTTTTAPAETGYPLTGLPIDDPARAAQPLLAVKIDNAEPRRGRGGPTRAGRGGAHPGR